MPIKLFVTWVMSTSSGIEMKEPIVFCYQDKFLVFLDALTVSREKLGVGVALWARRLHGAVRPHGSLASGIYSKECLSLQTAHNDVQQAIYRLSKDALV